MSVFCNLVVFHVLNIVDSRCVAAMGSHTGHSLDFLTSEPVVVTQVSTAEAVPETIGTAWCLLPRPQLKH